MQNNQFIWYNEQAKQLFSNEELNRLLKKSDLLGLWELTKTWAWISFAFAMVAIFPNVVTIIIALWIIGGKQLACAIILHDAGHYSLFATKEANISLGNFFGGWPIGMNVGQYRPYHLEHHKYTGTDDDPDLMLTRGYPATKKSMTRKFVRDLLGITGIKSVVGLIAMHTGYLEFNLGNRIRKNRNITLATMIKNSWKNLRGPVTFQLFLVGVLYLVGHPWLYILWAGAYIFTYPFCIRVRSIAEHSMSPDRTDPQVNSRTVKANVIERLLFAPLYVNYHVEHHLLMGVPCYRLPEMHKKLKERGFFEKALYEKSYVKIITMACSKKNEVNL